MKFFLKKQDNKKISRKNQMIVWKFPRPSIDKIHDSLQIIYKEVQKTNLYKEDWSVDNDMKQTIYMLNQVYNYIYNKQKSNLSKEDVEIFVDHLMRKMKDVKEITEKIW